MGEEDPNPREKENGMGGINVLNDPPCTYDCVLSFIFCMSFQRLHFFFFVCISNRLWLSESKVRFIL